MTESRKGMEPNWVDPDDAPQLDHDFFERADEFRAGKLVCRGRPRSDNPKLPVKIRYDREVIEHFKATGKGWQTRINDFLKQSIREGRV